MREAKEVRLSVMKINIARVTITKIFADHIKMRRTELSPKIIPFNLVRRCSQKNITTENSIS